MKKLRVFRNQDIKTVYIGPPKGHKHLRLIIETGDEILVFQEATLAAITRGYIHVKTHPIRRAVKMVSQRLEDRKDGYAEYQLIEAGEEEEIIENITRILGL